MVEIFLKILFSFFFIFIGYYVTRALDKRHLPKIEAARQRAITGKWSGLHNQEANGDREGRDITIELELKAGLRKIIGSMIVSEDEKYEFVIEDSCLSQQVFATALHGVWND